MVKILARAVEISWHGSEEITNLLNASDRKKRAKELEWKSHQPSAA